jgi:CheY-like chemotaxis protein
MSGACLLDLLRSHPATRDIPVVFVSSGNDPISTHSDRLAADAYVERPTDLKSYCTVLAATLSPLLPRVLRPLDRQLQRDLATGTPHFWRLRSLLTV